MSECPPKTKCHDNEGTKHEMKGVYREDCSNSASGEPRAFSWTFGPRACGVVPH